MVRCACPLPDELRRLLGGGLSADERAQVSDHVEGCDACQGRLDALVADDTVVPLSRSAEAPEEAGPDDAFLTNLRQLVSQAALASGGLAFYARADRDRAEQGPACPESIGGYEIIEEIARGGMAVVYKARQPHL